MATVLNSRERCSSVSVYYCRVEIYRQSCISLNQIYHASSTTDGLVYYEIIHGSVNRDVFHHFMTSLSVILGEERAVLFMDSATCHANVMLDSENLQIKYLPPNSPFLNPIENCCQSLKVTWSEDKIGFKGKFWIEELLLMLICQWPAGGNLSWKEKLITPLK